MLISLAAILFIDLLGSVNGLMEKAGTPDYLQMHAGEVDPDKIKMLLFVSIKVKGKLRKGKESTCS